MSVIDERIVSMVFDNSRFQQNAQNTMDSLDALDDSINEYANNTSKSFLDLSDGLSRIDVIFAGFYERVGGYLADLTMKGVAFSKSLSIDQVTAGFGKYTAETLAVQTIVSNTNNTLDHTYEILGDILAYTDKTSYHYDAMTNTIAKFANQGVALETAAAAVKGIANWAAVSGAGIDKADITMQALIRSMASGNMQMREWRTISQSANMGTAQFKETIIETAQALAKQGKASKKWNQVTVDNFEEMAFGTKKLVTNDVLLATLQKYSDEESELGQKALAAASEAKTFAEAIGAVKDAVSTGFGTSFKLLFGNYDEARKFWTGIQDAMLEVFTLGIGYRNEVLQIWHDSAIGGYTAAVKGLADAWEGLKNVVKPVGDAFHEVFGLIDTTVTANKVINLTKKFADFGEKFKMVTSGWKREGSLAADNLKLITGLAEKGGKKTIKSAQYLGDEIDKYKQYSIEAEGFWHVLWDIGNVARGVFNAIKTLASGTVEFFNGFKSAFSGIGGVIGSVGSFASTVSTFVTAISQAIEDTKFFGRIGSSLGQIINSILKPAFELVSKIIGKFSNKIGEAADKENTLYSIFDKVATLFEKFANFLTKKAIGPAIQFISDAFGSLSSRLEPVAEKLGKVKDAIVKFFRGTEDIDGSKVSGFTRVLDTLGKTIKFLWDVVKKTVGKIFDGIKNAFSGADLGDILAGGGIAAVTIALRKFLKFLTDWNNGMWDEGKKLLTNGMSVITSFGEQFGNVISNLQGMADVKILKEMATSVLILAAALFVLSMVDSDRVVGSLAAVSALLIEMVGVLDHIGRMRGAFDMKATFAITAMGKVLQKLAISILILSAALFVISKIDKDRLLASVIVVEVLIATLTASAKILTKDSGRIFKGGLALVELALAVTILASAVKKLAELSWTELAIGLVGVIVLLGSISGAALLLKNSGLNAGMGLAFIEIAAALKILTGVVQTLGSMDTDQLKQGLIAVAAALVAIGAAMNLFPKEGMVAIGAGLVLVGAGLKLIAKTIGTLGSMDLPTLGKGIGSVLLSLTALGGILHLFNGTLGGAAAMLVMSAALVVFAEAIRLVSDIPFWDMAEGLAILVVGMASLGGVMALLSGLAPGMIVVAAAFAILGVAIAAIGVGFLAISAAGSGAIATFNLLIKTIVNLIPLIIQKIGEGLVAIAGVLANSFAAIVEGVATVLAAILEALVLNIPKVVELISVLIIAILDMLIDLIPKAVEVVVTLILALIDAVKRLVPAIIDAGVTIVVSIIEGIASMVVAIVQAGIDMVVSILNGIASAIRDPYNVTRMVDAGWNILTSLWDGFVMAVASIWPKIKEKGAEFLAGFKEGLDEKLQIVKEFFTGLPGKIKEWIAEKWQALKEAGSNLVSGFKQGIENAWGKVKSFFTGRTQEVVDIANTTFDSHSPSRVFEEIGRNVDEGLILGMKDYSDKVNDATADMAGGAVSTMQDALSDISNIPFDELEDPVIKPILDLSDVENGAGKIDSMLSNNYSLGLSASAGLDRNAGQNSDIYSPTINMTINGAQGQDVGELADIVADRINRTLRSRERVWA